MSEVSDLPTSHDEPLLSIHGARRSFGPTKALDGVDIEARAGEVHAVLGENGAGKSTLMNVLGGGIALDAGVILLGGRPYAPRDPRQARDAGVAMVHQELTLCPHLTVAENILLGREPARFGVLQRDVMRRRAEEALVAAAGPASSFSPGTLVGDLAPSEQQLVEIARALADDTCRVLILDEPTSSLGQSDVDRLFDRIRAMKRRGLLILYISHFLQEIERIADRFTALRDGRTVGAGVVAATSMADVVTLMAGRPVAAAGRHASRARSDVALAADAVAGEDKPTSASFEVHEGEILGIAGLVGSGRTELLRTIFGLDPMTRGRVRVGAHPNAGSRAGSPAARLAEGVGMLSEDRKGEGLALGMSVADNLTLSRLEGFGPLGIVFFARQAHAAERWIDALHVRCNGPAQAAGDLSGGNQQKVALGRLLHHDVSVLLLDQPTRGIDIAAKADVYRTMGDLAERGKAIVVVSDDLSELLAICDRIAVMHRGVLGRARPTDEWTPASLLAQAVGAVA